MRQQMWSIIFLICWHDLRTGCCPCRLKWLWKFPEKKISTGSFKFYRKICLETLEELSEYNADEIDQSAGYDSWDGEDLEDEEDEKEWEE